MGLLALTLPSIGSPNATEDVDIVNAFTAIQTEYNANIPNILGAWRPLFGGQLQIGGGGGGAATWYAAYFGGIAQSGVENGNGVIGVYYIDPAHYAVSGYTTQLRVQVSLMTNATAPNNNSTAGLFPVSSVAGTANNNNLTLGSSIVATAINNPAANSIVTSTSGNVTMPGAVQTIVGVTLSAANAANARTVISVLAQYRYV